jgi:hypothetical protein
MRVAAVRDHILGQIPRQTLRRTLIDGLGNSGTVVIDLWRAFHAVCRGRADYCFWHEGAAEGGAKPVRLCPSSSDVNLFRYGEGIIDFDAEIPDGALDLCMSQRVGFVLRISFLIENQRPVAHRSVLAVATGCAGR